MDKKRDSVMFKVLWKIDSLWLHLDGYSLDFERLDWVYQERPIFTKQGLIKTDLSLIPGRDSLLKKYANEQGGWKCLTSQSFCPSEDFYCSLESVGYTRAEFEHSRRYLADKSIYMRAGLGAQYKKKTESGET